ncbi:signal peptidase I [Sporosarcina aquimarina]|uniref:Signal peptidase I n=1 Tax=Sporosarcina aquimarina TaxID=114975 RepID=A0ABU4FVH0_9BACL|nr:signal peptidase I [Sporosarcina aquimarina]MDW0108711.1 signal peptidase I [Sporosarcina aquimarina]
MLSNSMNPIFKTGDMLFVKKVDPTAIHEGDIITFKESGGNLINHRVVDVTDSSGAISFATKDDNNNMVGEELVPSRNLLGKQVFFFPGVGSLVKTIQSPLGLLLVVILPTIGYFAIGLFSRKEDKVSVEGN